MRSKEPINQYAKASQAALQFVSLVSLLGFGGYKIDQWLNLKFPLFLLLGIIGGSSIGIYLLLKSLNRKK